jgi:hypothetical protein
MSDPALKRSIPTLAKVGAYLLMLLMVFLPGACIDKQEILKEGTRVVIPGDGISMAGILYGPADPGKSDPAVIVLHGWLEPEENGADMVSIVAWHLAREGYVHWPSPCGDGRTQGAGTIAAASSLWMLFGRSNGSPANRGSIPNVSACWDSPKGHRWPFWRQASHPKSRPWWPSSP